MPFQIKLASAQDFDAVLTLIQAVWACLPQKEWFAADPPSQTRRLLEQGKMTAYQAVETKTGKLAGVFLTAFPGRSRENLGRDIGLPDTELERVAHMDTAAILPEYRGNRLQIRLMRRAEEDLRQQGFGYLLCTVHPDNRFSRDNMLRQGYQAVKITKKYGGLPREILCKELK